MIKKAISIACSALLASTTMLSAQNPTSDSLRLYYVGRPVGWERYDFTLGKDGKQFTADFDYIDRGRRIHLASTMVLAPDYSPRHLEVARIADTTHTIVTRVDVNGQTASVVRNGQTADVALPSVAFALSPFQPMSQHLALLRYWRAHGSPPSMAVVPGAPTNNVAIKKLGVDSIRLADGKTVALTRYSIDGIVWGLEYAWLDTDDRLAMFATAAGGLSFKAVRADLVPDYTALMEVASRGAIKDLRSISARTKPEATGAIALVGATLIDATGAPAVEHSTVVVANGRIVAAGPSATTSVPVGTKRVDVTGKTIIPGLWDSHAHLHQLEWIPAYIAAGVTTVRDMGNELPFITALRTEVESGRVNGPRILLAGLVDGPGPNAFGALSATTPDEGREIVRMYRKLGFGQMKLYSLLSPAVVGAICDEAHKLGMTVTGHIPVSLSLLAAVDSGMDQVAHLPIRGDPASDSVKRVIQHLRDKGTVLDPTASWAEIGGHSTAEPLNNFQPVVDHLPATFVQTRVAGWGAVNVDPATAHQRLARTLATVRALHDAGVPIIAGTDEGVPGFSVYREIELYTMAGFTPIEAIRSATAVPAVAMGIGKDVGTIERGKRADLLVLDANPLDNISNIRTVLLVMKDGRLYDSAALWRGAGFNP
jgi:imidazolonepropionase-like amidohydrolase